MDERQKAVGAEEPTEHDDSVDLGSVAAALFRNVRLLVLGTAGAVAIAVAIAALLPPVFTARTTFLPPEQQQSAATMALASLGPLASLAGGIAPVRTPADLFVALMYSVTVSDRLIDRHKLMEVYRARYRVEAREELRGNVRITVGKKDGLISVEVDDHDPKRAAAMANDLVAELREVTSGLAVSEAQQRRKFFEGLLAETSARLARSQRALMETGFQPGSLKAEPRTAIEGYARLQAEVMAAEVRLKTLRNALRESAPEVRQADATLAALRAQLARTEKGMEIGDGPDYIAKYREYKYSEALFELYARQFEIARVDESREGAPVQVIDAAVPPERKSRPRLAVVAAVTAVSSLFLLAVFAVRRESTGRAGKTAPRGAA